MHKRRLDLLKNLSDQLNPTYYVDLLRQIWFEMGETYITMIDLKSDQVLLIYYIHLISKVDVCGTSKFAIVD